MPHDVQDIVSFVIFYQVFHLFSARQWGAGNGMNGNGQEQSVTYPIRFSTCFGALVSVINTIGISERFFQVTAYSSTGATFRIVHTGSVANVNIIPFWWSVGK